jgi:hypothetical protein
MPWLAELCTADLRELYPDEELSGLTANSIRSRAERERELDGVRRRGVAAAFSASSSPSRLAINVSVSASRMRRPDSRRIGELPCTVVAEAGGVVR